MRYCQRQICWYLTAALTRETRGILNKTRLARLPDGAAIINIARGGLIDLEAMTQEVKRKRLRCALDVTDPTEPLPVGHVLRRLPEPSLHLIWPQQSQSSSCDGRCCDG